MVQGGKNLFVINFVLQNSRLETLLVWIAGFGIDFNSNCTGINKSFLSCPCENNQDISLFCKLPRHLARHKRSLQRHLSKFFLIIFWRAQFLIWIYYSSVLDRYSCQSYCFYRVCEGLSLKSDLQRSVFTSTCKGSGCTLILQQLSWLILSLVFGQM